MLDELPDHAEVVLLSGEVKRRRVVPFVADVRVGASIEQQGQGLFAVAPNGVVQCRAEAGVSRKEAPLVHQLRRRVEDCGDQGGITGEGSREQGLDAGIHGIGIVRR